MKTNKMLITVAFIGFMMGMFISTVFYETSKSESTCEVVQTKIRAFQQCLKFQPGCQMNKGPEMFAEHKGNKDWVVEHCPKNGDGFQSQSSE